MRACPALIVLVVFSVSISAQDWPSFRGPNASGISAERLPTSWDVPGNSGVKWRRTLPGLSHASPVVFGDRVYVISASRVQGSSTVSPPVEQVVFADDAVPHRWRLYALDRATGAVVWERTPAENMPRQPRHVRGTYANATPATNGRVIVVSLGYEGLFAFDSNGTQLWHQPGPPEHDTILDPASSPVIHDNVAIVQNDWRRGGHVAAYDLVSGKPVWRAERNEGMGWSTPSVVGSGDAAQLVTNGPRFIRAYDPRTGRVLWQIDNTAQGTWDRVSTPVSAGALTIVAGGGAERPIYAIGANAPATTWTIDRGSPYLCTPLAYDGLLYVLASNGVVTQYDLQAGARVAQHRVSAGVGFSASPVAAGGYVYFTNEDGVVTVARAGRDLTIVARNPLGAMTFATPALTTGTIIFRTVSEVIAIG
jgi:outer membrane protein assembly factor BamB